MNARPGATAFSWSVFPVVMFGSVALSIAIFANGGSESLATLVGLLFGYTIVILGERLYPFVPDWNRNHDDVATDAAWAGTTLVTGAILRPGSVIVGAWLAARFHFVDIGLIAVSYTVPLIALGADGRVFALWIVASTVHGICQHANMQIRCGPLNWIFSMAELHRWHHSPLVRESNTNYGQTLILWDIVFGTRFLPTDRKPPEAVGIANLSGFPMTWWAQLCSPWRWDRVETPVPDPTARWTSASP